MYIGRDDVRLDAIDRRLLRARRVVERLISESSSQARWLSPSAANAMTAQIAACVYWPPFSLTPGGYPLM